MRRASAVALLLVSLLASCKKSSPGITTVPPTQGTVRVLVGTTGQAIDTAGYFITVDGGLLASSATVDDTVYFEMLEGTHAVTLRNLPGNCDVQGDNPVAVVVTAPDTSTVSFPVVCSTGTLQVLVSTTGDSIPAAGYVASVDSGASVENVAPDDTVSFDIPSGSHSLELTGVPSNCQVGVANPQQVIVPANAAVLVGFPIVCRAP